MGDSASGRTVDTRMSSITGTSFNWLPQQSMYDEMQSWSARRSQGVSEATSASDTFNSAFSTAVNNTISGTAALALQTALTRIQKKTATTLGGDTGYKAPTSTPSLSAASIANIKYAASANMFAASSSSGGLVSVLG